MEGDSSHWEVSNWTKHRNRDPWDPRRRRGKALRKLCQGVRCARDSAHVLFLGCPLQSYAPVAVVYVGCACSVWGIGCWQALSILPSSTVLLSQTRSSRHGLTFPKNHDKFCKSWVPKSNRFFFGWTINLYFQSPPKLSMAHGWLAIFSICF